LLKTPVDRKAFTISITDVNEAPTDITLSNSTIAENQPINTVVGSFSTTDPDAGETFNYSLVSGTGDTDNGSFNISGTQLRSSEVFDVETKSSYSIRVRTSDGALSYDEAFTITVTFSNQAPTDITLSNSSVAENSSVNTLVGTLTTSDGQPLGGHLVCRREGRRQEGRLRYLGHLGHPIGRSDSH
jgi:hypothetical protein